MSDLKPCPFCESDTAQTSEIRWNPVMTKWAVVCVHGCDAQGPPADTEGEAIAAWNARPPVSAAAITEAIEQRQQDRQARAICSVCGTVGSAEHKAYCSESI